MICHINLAKGFRGGERQTTLLVNELSRHFPKLKQRVIIRRGSPIQHHLNKEVEIIQIDKPFIFSISSLADCAVYHAHETKAAQFAFLGHILYGKPYFITRRVTFKPSQNIFNKLMYSKASCVFTISNAINDVMTKNFNQIRTSVIPSALTPLQVTNNIRELKNRFNGKFIILHIGALVDSDKGQSTIIEAARLLEKSHNDIHFILLGEGEDEAKLKMMASGLSNITFEGFKKNIGDYLSIDDLFVFPSKNEGLGSILLDALSFGKPIIASSVGGIVDIIKNDYNGILIPPDNPEILKNKILDLYNDKSKKDKLSYNAKSSASEYQIENLLPHYLKYYRNAGIEF